MRKRMDCHCRRGFHREEHPVLDRSLQQRLTRTLTPSLIACQQLCDRREKTCADLRHCLARLSGDNYPIGRQTNCNRCEKDSGTFRAARFQSNRYWSESVDLPPRPVTVKSVNFDPECMRPQAESSTSFQMRTTHNSFIVNAIQRLQS